jgi:hypothetical protein
MPSKKKAAKTEQLVVDTSERLQKLAKKAHKEAEKYINTH